MTANVQALVFPFDAGRLRISRLPVQFVRRWAELSLALWQPRMGHE